MYPKKYIIYNHLIPFYYQLTILPAIFSTFQNYHKPSLNSNTLAYRKRDQFPSPLSLLISIKNSSSIEYFFYYTTYQNR